MNSIPGIDMAEGLKRAGHQHALYMRFLKRFPADPTFRLLCHALEESRLHDAFLYAHTLKGLTAQLGIFSLHAPLCNLCDTLRSENPNARLIANEYLCAIQPVYEEIIHQLSEVP